MMPPSRLAFTFLCGIIRYLGCRPCREVLLGCLEEYEYCRGHRFTSETRAARPDREDYGKKG